ncbi:hypothetical protein SAMN04489832_6393 [Micromonospora cremea]|uniref:FXSXX-COOH protein n=1 Tax=Micromonospora cremea TaxID=709881 RepID=A0A1N6AYS9_9ACTN|nr:hypothetical protein SAMN04489832_6393 [Micromonospora cremea]
MDEKLAPPAGRTPDPILSILRTRLDQVATEHPETVDVLLRRVLPPATGPAETVVPVSAFNSAI